MLYTVRIVVETAEDFDKDRVADTIGYLVGNETTWSVVDASAVKNRRQPALVRKYRPEGARHPGSPR